MGIERSIHAAQRARIIILMTEPGVPYPDIQAHDSQTVIHVVNKTEQFQAKFGIGIDNLKQQLLAAVPHASDSDVIISNARHYEALCRAKMHLQRVINGLSTNLCGDLLSEDLRLVLSELGEITGEGQITTSEVLNNIFQHFCVGK